MRQAPRFDQAVRNERKRRGTCARCAGIRRGL